MALSQIYSQFPLRPVPLFIQRSPLKIISKFYLKGIQSSSYGRPPLSQFTDSGNSWEDPLYAIFEHLNPGTEFLPNGQRGGVLQVGPAGFYNILIQFFMKIIEKNLTLTKKRLYSFCFLSRLYCKNYKPGIRISLHALTVAIWTTDGKTSLEDWDMFTWSLGWTSLDPLEPPRISIARLAITSLLFIFDWVPDPVCQITIDWEFFFLPKGKWSFHFSWMTSSAA